MKAYTASAGFIDARYIVQKFETEYDLKIDCEKNLDIFLAKGIIEANNRLEEYSQEVDQVRITSFGNYTFDFLAFDFTYLDLVSLDCGIFDERLANYFIKAAYSEVDFYTSRRLYERVLSRIERVEKFIEYLIRQEEKEFIDLAIPSSEMKFSLKIQEKFQVQKTRVLKSAKDNTKGQGYQMHFFN